MPCLLMEEYASDTKYFIKKEIPGTADEFLYVKQSASSCRIDEITVSIFVPWEFFLKKPSKIRFKPPKFTCKIKEKIKNIDKKIKTPL